MPIMLHYIIIILHHYIISFIYSFYPSLCLSYSDAHQKFTLNMICIFWITNFPGSAQSNPQRISRVLMVLIVEGRNATSEEKSKIPAQRNDKMSMFCKSWNKRNNQKWMETTVGNKNTTSTTTGTVSFKIIWSEECNGGKILLRTLLFNFNKHKTPMFAGGFK